MVVSEMVERCAKALYYTETASGRPDWAREPESVKNHVRAKAIVVMRETMCAIAERWGEYHPGALAIAGALSPTDGAPEDPAKVRTL